MRKGGRWQRMNNFITHAQVANINKKSQLIVSEILQGVLIVGDFVKELQLSKLSLGFLTIALFEVQTKDKSPFKNNSSYFSSHALLCFIKLIMLLYTPFSLQL